MSAAREPWSDERLAAAFAVRAAQAPSPPPHLADGAVTRVAAIARRPRAPSAWTVGLAASLATLVLVAGVVWFNRSLVPTAASTPPSAPSTSIRSPASTAASSSASSASGPATIPTVDVTEALRIRDSAHDGRELAVAGFLTPSPGVMSCPMVLSSDMIPPLVHCPGSFLWLMQTAERTVTGTTIQAPHGPAFHPSFDVVGMDALAAWPTAARDPVATVLVGHFDDRRSSLCPSDRYGGPAKCRETFVVDRIQSFGGVEQSVTTEDRIPPGESIRPVTSAADVDRLVATVSREQPVLSRVLLPGGALWSVEPSLRADSRWLGARLVWLVTTLDGAGAIPVARTWLVVDGTSTIARMTDENEASLAIVTSRADQTVLCGRLNLDRCAAAIALVRVDHSNDVDRAWRIVVDDSCPPRVACDRLYPFDAFIVLIPDPGSGSGLQAYHVTGLGEEPEQSAPWAGPLPAFIQAELPVPSQSPGAS